MEDYKDLELIQQQVKQERTQLWAHHLRQMQIVEHEILEDE